MSLRKLHPIERGSALVVGLIGTILLAFSIASIHHYIRYTVRLHQIRKIGPKTIFAKEVALIENKELIGQAVNCQRLDSKGQNGLSLCIAQSAFTKMPLLDYNALFKHVAPCSSLLSKDSCSIPEEPLVGDYISLHNLKGPEVSLIGPGVRLLASPGEVMIDTLLLATDAALISGEDMKITSIASNDGLPHKLTLISAKGSIELGSIDTTTSVLPVARRSYNGPSRPASPPYPIPGWFTIAVLARQHS